MRRRATTGTPGLTSANDSSPLIFTSTGATFTTTQTFGALKSWTLTASGSIQTITVGYGVRSERALAVTRTGRPIVTATGSGVRLTVRSEEHTSELQSRQYL